MTSKMAPASRCGERTVARIIVRAAATYTTVQAMRRFQAKVARRLAMSWYMALALT